MESLQAYELKRSLPLTKRQITFTLLQALANAGPCGVDRTSPLQPLTEPKPLARVLKKLSKPNLSFSAIGLLFSGPVAHLGEFFTEAQGKEMINRFPSELVDSR